MLEIIGLNQTIVYLVKLHQMIKSHKLSIFISALLICLGSGLFVACKYPIIAIEFQPFQYRTYYARAFSYGVVCLKVGLEYKFFFSTCCFFSTCNCFPNSFKIRIDNEKVAYVANLHAQACQGKDTVLHYQFTETLSAVNAFRLKTQLPEDVVVFDTICGDFNFDNMVSILIQDWPF